MVRQNPGRFRAWVPGDEQTRGLQLLAEGRGKLVEDMTALTNQLTSVLKTDYPQALNWAGYLSREQACSFLEKWGRPSRICKGAGLFAFESFTRSMVGPRARCWMNE